MYPGQNKYKKIQNELKKEINISGLVKKDFEILQINPYAFE